jgi:hypothetical protein
VTRAASTQELRPNNGAFASEDWPPTYELALRQGLLGEHAMRLCQLLAMPSFSGEWVVYIVQAEDGGPRVIAKRFREHLYSRMFPPPPPPPASPGLVTPSGALAAAPSVALPDPAVAERMAALARARTDAERRQIERELRTKSQALLRRMQ